MAMAVVMKRKPSRTSNTMLMWGTTLAVVVPYGQKSLTCWITIPCRKLPLGDVLQDYQTIYRTQQGIQPFYNTSYALRFSNSFYNGGELYVAYLRGISNNVNSQSFNDYFIFTNANQLSSHYDLFSFQYEGKISDWKLSYKAEPEFLFNSSEYLYRGEVAHTTAYRLFAGLKFTYTPHEQVKLYYYPKYSYFIFDNSISQGRGKFDFLTNKLELTTYFFDKKLLAEAGFQQVNSFKRLRALTT